MFIGIEVKREHGGGYGVTPKQEYELQRVRKSGGYAVVAVYASDVVQVLNAIDEKMDGTAKEKQQAINPTGVMGC